MSLEFKVISESPGWHRVEALKDGKKVSWLSVPDLKLHYGTASITVGGVAGVYTPREHRGRGYSAATLRYAVGWMKEQGYSLSALFGILEYYHRFGFATFMGEHTVTICLRNASRIEAEDLEWELSSDSSYASQQIAEIYEQVNAAWPGARVRDPSSWKGFRKGVAWEHPAKPLVLKRSGRVVAYAALERWPGPEELLIAEVGAAGHDRSLYRALARRLYGLALEERRSFIKIHVPPNHPFVDVVRPYGVKVESTYFWSGGGMARVINLAKLLNEMRLELERRAAGIEGDLTLQVEGEAVTLRVRDGSVKIDMSAGSVNVVKLGPGEAAQLFLGYRDPVEVLVSSEVHGEPKLLTKLFPKATPYVWQPDRW